MSANGLPGISVVTIGLNAADQLPLTLESVIAQDYPSLELVVVDGCSWDNTRNVVDRYRPAIARFEEIEDAGIYYAMNAAMGFVTQDYVLFMNAGDQFYSEDAISSVIGAADKNADIIYGNHIYVSAGIEAFKRSASFELIADRLRRGEIDWTWAASIPCHQATFTRCDLLRRLPYDTRLRISADHDLLFRAHAAGATMSYVDEIVSHYYGGGFSARMGELTRLEGASVYRRFSDDPRAVDRLFYPGGSPFVAHTARTGWLVGGTVDSGRAGRDTEDRSGQWLTRGGALLVSPAVPADALELVGRNDGDPTRLLVEVSDGTVSVIDLPRGYFHVEAGFDTPVDPASHIVLRSADEPAEDRPAGLTLILLWSFAFLSGHWAPRVGLKPGAVLSFGVAETDLTGILAQGWSGPEATHIWSTARESCLWLKVAPSADRLELAIGGNPHIVEGQEVTLRVNGEQFGSERLSGDARISVAIDCRCSPWRPGQINQITFTVDKVATPPAETGDFRTLGIRLWEASAF